MKKIINFHVVLKIVSRTLFISSFLLLVCAGVAIYFSEEVSPFIYSSIISFLIGVISFSISREQSDYSKMLRKDAYLTVTLSWLITALIGCLPYILSGAIPNFINAFFESVSGFTTTGSSILTEIESLPKSILLWRSLTHWIGGIGIIVLVIIIMPTLQI